MAIFKLFTDVEIKVDINVAEFTSRFTESTLLYYNTVEQFCMPAH